MSDVNSRLERLRGLLVEPPTAQRASAIAQVFAAWGDDDPEGLRVARGYVNGALSSQIDALVAETPTATAWAAIASLFDTFRSTETRRRAVEAAAPALEHWPETTRIAAPEWWLSPQLGGAGDVLTLARSLEVTRAMLSIGWGPFFADPRLRRIVVLDLGGCRVGAAGMTGLVESPHLGALRQLELRRNGLDSALLEPLRDWEGIATLRALELGHNRLGRDGIVSLLDGVHPASLESLSIPATGIGDDGLRRLAASGVAEQLTRLDVASNGLAAASSDALSEFVVTGRLETLDVSANPLGSAGLARLLDAGPGSLHTLVLRSVGLDQRVGSLLESGGLGGLRAIDLADNGVGRDVRAVSRALPRSLRALGLASNHLAEAGASALAAASFPVLRALDLRDNGLGPDGLNALATGGYLDRLEHLDVSGNPIGDEGVVALAALTTAPVIRTLRLARCGIGPRGATILATSDAFANLRHLDLAGNQVGTDGSRALAESLSLAELTTLELGENRLRDADIRALAASKRLRRLMRLDLEPRRSSHLRVPHWKAASGTNIDGEPSRRRGRARRRRK